MATYTANLAAYLTVTLERKPVNSLQELADSTAVVPLIPSGTNLQTLLEVCLGPGCFFGILESGVVLDMGHHHLLKTLFGKGTNDQTVRD